MYWTEWDYALATAHQFIADHTDEHGHLVWERDHEDVEMILERKIDRHQAKVDRRTNGKNYKAQPGEYWVSRLELMPFVVEQGGDWPTAGEWYESQYLSDTKDDE